MIYGISAAVAWVRVWRRGLKRRSWTVAIVGGLVGIGGYLHIAEIGEGDID